MTMFCVPDEQCAAVRYCSGVQCGWSARSPFLPPDGVYLEKHTRRLPKSLYSRPHIGDTPVTSWPTMPVPRFHHGGQRDSPRFPAFPDPMPAKPTVDGPYGRKTTTAHHIPASDGLFFRSDLYFARNLRVFVVNIILQPAFRYLQYAGNTCEGQFFQQQPVNQITGSLRNTVAFRVFDKRAVTGLAKIILFATTTGHTVPDNLLASTPWAFHKTTPDRQKSRVVYHCESAGLPVITKLSD